MKFRCALFKTVIPAKAAAAAPGILLLTLLSTPAYADQKGDCGTIVLPTGIGETAPADITSFNPIFSNTAYNEEAGWLLFPNLIWINRYSQIDWYRSLASSVSSPDQGTTYDVVLRPWHWSDGVQLTAADVIYEYNLIKKLGPEWPGYGQGGLPDIIKSFNVISPTHFQVILKHQVNPTWFIYNGLSSLEPVPEHAWAKYSIDQLFQNQSSPKFFDVVDGPVKIKNLAIGLDAVFVPNPAFDGPKMHFDQLVFKFLEGDGAAVQGVLSGDMDAATLVPSLWDYAAAKPGFYIQVLPPGGFQNVIVINLKNPHVSFFDDVRVRDAIEDSINQTGMIKLLFHNEGDPSYGPYPPSPPTFVAPSLLAGHIPVGYDPAKSLSLLAQAGYTRGPDGIMQKNGQRLSFIYLLSSGSGNLEEMAEILQDDFRKVGVEMKVYEMDFNQMLALMAGPATGWEAAGVGQPVATYPTGEGQYATGAFQNEGGYSDPTMDKLIAASTSKPGNDALFAYEVYATAQQPVIWFPTARVAILSSNHLHGILDFVDPAGQFSPDQLYCSTNNTVALR
jgi:peptide/nickel transport system substrate-binding protein